MSEYYGPICQTKPQEGSILVKQNGMEHFKMTMKQHLQSNQAFTAFTISNICIPGKFFYFLHKGDSFVTSKSGANSFLLE